MKIPGILAGICCSLLTTAQTITGHIHIDQFGYLPQAQKVAVIADPQIGYNAAQSYAPGNTLQVKRSIDDVTVFTDAPSAWNSWNTHAQSGDVVWWFDFSSVTAPGSYYIYDQASNTKSYDFEISDCAYHMPLKAVLKSFYYQRCGMSKSVPYAAMGNADTSCHTGTLQDTDCRLYSNPTAGTSKDLSGGWHDAGDYNKYVNFAWATLIDMLLAYEEDTAVWTDDTGIPESGNSFPDLLDEIHYELDWLLKMQNPDGSVLSVIGGGAASPPSADAAQRYYGPATTSASFSAAAMHALAAIQFNRAGNTAYAQTLETAAVNAFNWAETNPNISFYNAGTLAAGEQQTDAYGTSMRRLSAAAFLYALTQQNSYKNIFEADYGQAHLIQWGYAYLFEAPEQDFLLYYAKQPGISVPVKTAIQDAYANSLRQNNADNLPAFLNETDAYRAYVSDQNYTWGSNTFKCRQGCMFTSMNELGLDTANAGNYMSAAAGFLHYMHGVNPVAKTYISNMNNFGAENSVTQLYHAWFENGSALWDETGVSTYGPVPGLVPGGANPTYDWDGCCPNNCGSPQNNALCYSENIDPPKNQPIQKSYKDFNNSWPLNSWEITEPGIYTHAAYLRLVSKFNPVNCSFIPTAVEEVEQKGLTIYPNPATNTISLNIKGDKDLNEYTIFYISGTIVLKGNFSEGNAIDISMLSPGAYIISSGEFRKIFMKI